MQCKDIPDLPILEFLVSLKDPKWCDGYRWATWFNGYDNSVQNGMPENVPEKLALAKMKQLIKRGLVDGCGCGCRGDFILLKKGFDFIGDKQ